MTTESPNSTDRKPPATARVALCAVCGDPFEARLPNARYCSDLCRHEGAEQKAAERKQKTGQSSGLGDVSIKAKASAQALALSAGVSPKNLPKELKWSNQAGKMHLTLTPDRLYRFIENLSRLPHPVLAAQATDGVKGTYRAFLNFYRQGRAGKSQQATAFADAWDAAVLEAGAEVMQAAYEEAVTGKQIPIVSMGNIVAHEHSRDGKLLAQMLKFVSPDFAKANSSGGNTNVQVNVHSGANANPDDPSNPTFTFSLSETYGLTDIEREQLENIATKIISRRKSETVTVSLAPDALMKQALDTPIQILDGEYSEIVDPYAIPEGGI